MMRSSPRRRLALTPQALHLGSTLIAPLTLASGLLLSLLTQLRSGDLALGPGEALLIIALMLFAATTCTGETKVISRPLQALLIFWGVFLVAQCFGFVTAGLMGDRHDTSLVIHDVATYPILIATTLLTAVDPGAASRLTRTTWCMALGGALLCLLQLATAADLFHLPDVDPWYWDRLRGWTTNPNQFALFCLIVALLSLHLSATAETGAQRGVALVCAGIAIGTGILAKTNAFGLALAIGTGIFAAFKITSILFRRGRNATFGDVSAWALVVGLPVLIAAALPIASATAPNETLAGSFSRDSSDATDSEMKIRFQLWHAAIERGFESKLMGLGPGPHLPIPAVLLDARWGVPFEPSNVVHPTPGGAPNFEAHNSLLELFVQGGALAVASFLGLAGTCFVACLEARRHVLFASLAAALVFGSFHVITRHPAFWFLVVVCLVPDRSDGSQRREHPRSVHFAKRAVLSRA